MKILTNGGGYYASKGTETYIFGRSWWHDHFMIGAKGNIVNTYLAEALSEYYKNEFAPLEYGVMANLAFRTYENIPRIKEIFDAIPNNNLDQFYLQQHCTEQYNFEEIAKVKENTYIFKMNWKTITPVDNPDSIYQHILRGEI